MSDKLNLLITLKMLICSEYDSFLAYSKVTGIETIHMHESSVDEAPNPNAPRPLIENASHMRNVIGLACDYKAKRYFFSDIQRGDIQSVNFDGSNFSVVIESKNVGYLKSILE
jgi:low-density lipoprotein receptor-related protein 1 (alpha-2-macroglobulin receptor)